MRQITDFRKKLADVVRDAGQDLIDNAEEYVGSVDLLSSMVITIKFDPEFSMMQPIIEIDKEYICKTAYDRYLKGENDEVSSTI